MTSRFSAFRVWPALLILSAITVTTSCERSSPVVSPSDDIRRQADVTGLTNLLFHVTRADNGAPVENATISVYLDSDATTPPTLCSHGEVVVDRNCWVFTDQNGYANLQVPTGGGVGWFARALNTEWLNFYSLIPPLDPGLITSIVPNDLDALVCARRGVSVVMTPGRLKQCIDNLYLVPRGPAETVELPLPVLGAKLIQILGPDGAPVPGNVHAYLVEDLTGNAPPWMTNLGPGIKPGFLRFFGLTNSSANFPGAAAYLEAYGTFSDGTQIAGTALVGSGGGTTTVGTLPVVCANGTENVDNSFSGPPTNPLFSFTSAKYNYSAVRGTTQPLVKDLTTTVVMTTFAQTGGPHTVDISQRHRTANGTNTASANFQCTNGNCDVDNAVINVPGTGNPMVPHIYQPEPFKLVWVVQGLDPAAASEFALKAFNGSTLLDQKPPASKKNAASAFKLISKGFTSCHVDFSNDGGWGSMP